MSDVHREKPVEEVKEAARQAVKKEVAPPPKREYRTWAFQVALFSAIGAFVVLTFMAASTPFFPLDLQITKALQSIDSPLFLAIMDFISWPGFAPQSVIISGLVVLVIYGLGFRWEAVIAAVAAALPQLINMLAKQLIQRPRPAVDVVDVFRVLDSYSFPSGHVMFYVGFFGFLWFFIFTSFKPSFTRTLLLGGLGALIVLVGISRIYLGQHWASDILGASLLGGLVLIFILQLYRWGKKRFSFNQPDDLG
jgi:undecaprenyl-diphosphatase